MTASEFAFLALGLALGAATGAALVQPNVLPVLAHAIPGTSTVRRSAMAYEKILIGRAFPRGTGLHVDFTLAELPSSHDSRREDWQDELLRFVEQPMDYIEILSSTVSATTSVGSLVAAGCYENDGNRTGRTRSVPAHACRAVPAFLRR